MIKCQVTVTKCLHPTTMEYQQELAGILPAKLHTQEATLCLACQAMEASHLLYSKITAPEQKQSRHQN